MIQIWRVIKAELSNAKLALGVIFLLSFGGSAVLSLSEGIAVKFVIFMSYMSYIGLNPCRPQFQRLPISLPVPVVAFGVVRVFAGAGAILVVLSGSGLAASLFYETPSTMMSALHWIFPLVIVVTSLQWILFDLANRSYRRFALASYVWIACHMPGSFALVLGKLDGVLLLVSEGSRVMGLSVAAVGISILSVLSFRRRRSFVAWEPGIRAQRGSRLVRPGRFVSLTILLNQIVSNWKAYVMSYVGLVAVFWWALGRKGFVFDLDNPLVVAKIAGTIIASMTLGAIVQGIAEGEGGKRFQYLLLPVSVSEVARYRVIQVLPFVVPQLLFWFIIIMRESPGPLYGLHWAFPAFLGWLCGGGAFANVVRDRWPRFRFVLGSNEWSPIGTFLPVVASFGTWSALAIVSVKSPESIAGGLGRALLWSPGGVGYVLVVGLVVALISVRTFERSSSRLV